MRIAVSHQGYVPPYRVRFFELLNERTQSEYVVFHGDPPPGLGHEAARVHLDFPNRRVRNHSLRLPGTRSVTYQALVREVVAGEFDAVVLGTHLQFVSNHVLFACSRLQNRAVLYWGHGDEKVIDIADDDQPTRSARQRPLTWLAHSGIQLKYAASRLPDGYLVYTDGGAARLLANGVEPHRVTVVRNTLDMDEQVELHDRWRRVDEAEVRRQLGLEPRSVVLVCVGRIYRAKRVDCLVDAVRELNERHGLTANFEVVIIGDGPAAPYVRAKADGLSNVILTGAIQDQDAVAQYLRVAAAVVAPGVVGLVANHALAHGLPLISQATQVHGPELEYLTPGKDSLLASNFDEFVTTLADIIVSPERLVELSAAALQTRRALSLDAMVEAFHSGVTRAVRRRRRQ